MTRPAVPESLRVAAEEYDAHLARLLWLSFGLNDEQPTTWWDSGAAAWVQCDASFKA